MQKSRLPLILLILALGCALCLCAAVIGVAVFRVIASYTEVDLPQMQALLEPTAEPEPLTTDSAPAVAIAPARSSAGVNRIVVQGADGSLYTIDPAGADRVALTADGPGLRVYRQPTWSPDARRIAWVEIEGADNALSSALVTSLSDGTEPTRVDTADRPPFYMAWSPDSAQIAALSSWDAGLALRTVDVDAGGASATLIAEAQPLYFAWSPDSQRLIAHLNAEAVSLLASNGAQTELDASAATFGAPDWTADGAAVVYAERAGGAQKLVLADPSGVALRDLAQFQGAVSFSLSADGDRVAFVDTADGFLASALGPLAVADVDGTAGAQVVDEDPVLAFFWSPQGDKIAYLALSQGPADGPRASLARTLEADHLDLWLQWRVWDGARAYDLSRFRPSDTFLIDYLRFFDQYARSMTPWAPDGSAFVYAGDSEDGVAGVYAQPVAEGSLPVRIGDGVFAAWSPR